MCTRSDFSRLEAPDVTGSSLTLGAAGSRRTVYLVDEKLPDTSAQSDSELGSNNRNNSSISNNNSSVSSSNNNNHSSPHDQSAPSTFLMYNRISNIIGDPAMINSNNPQSPNSSVINDNANKDKKKSNDEHVWYEYGCV